MEMICHVFGIVFCKTYGIGGLVDRHSPRKRESTQRYVASSPSPLMGVGWGEGEKQGIPILWILDQIQNDDAGASLPAALWIADQVRNDGVSYCGVPSDPSVKVWGHPHL